MWRSFGIDFGGRRGCQAKGSWQSSATFPAISGPSAAVNDSVVRQAEGGPVNSTLVCWLREAFRSRQQP